jgi:O-antigen ligase
VKSFSLKTHLFFSYLFVFGINLPNEYIPKLILAWIVGQLLFVVYHFHGFAPFSKKNIPNVLLILFYAWCLVTMTFSENKFQAMNLLEHRLLLIIIPILSLFSTQISINRNYLLYSFLFGNLFSIIICLFHFYETGLWGSSEMRHINFNISVNEFKHYSYFGLNLSVGFLLILYLFRDKKKYIQLSIMLTVAVTYILFIYLSQARMALFTILLACAIAFLKIIFQYRKSVIGSIVILIVFSILSFILIKNPRLYIHSDFQEMSIKDIDTNRDIIWQESIKLIKDKPLFGYGLGDTIIKINNTVSYNSHNQILDFFLEGGIISNILFFGAWIWIFFIRVPKSIKFYTISISSLFFIALLTESLLNRIAGVSLFIFIYYIFVNAEEKILTPKLSKALNLVSYSFILFVFILIVPISFSVLKKVDFDPKNPRTYSARPLNLIPFNKLPEGMKEGTIGCKLDSTSFSGTWEGNAYSYTLIARPAITFKDSLEASVYCYVSSEFNGTWVRVSSEGSSISNNLSEYNFNQKNTWQKLTIKPICKEGEVPIYLYIAQYNCTSFDSLQGYVIFAYPEVKINGKHVK